MFFFACVLERLACGISCAGCSNAGGPSIFLAGLGAKLFPTAQPNGVFSPDRLRQVQVPESSGRFRKVPAGFGAGPGCKRRSRRGSSGGFGKVPKFPECSRGFVGPGAGCKRRFQTGSSGGFGNVPEGSGRFRCMARRRLQAQVPDGKFRRVREGSGRFRRVPEGFGAGPGAGCKRRFRTGSSGGFGKVPEGSGGFRCRARRRLQAQVPDGRLRRVWEGFGGIRKVFLFPNSAS